MVLDYSERKPSAKNRPRKQPIGILAIILIGAVSISFALGLATGWFLFKPKLKTLTEQMLRSPEGQKSPPGSVLPSSPAQNPEAAAGKGAEPPLTFFETLPKGGKAVIGSGLNPKMSNSVPAPQPAAAASAQAPQPTVPKPAAPAAAPMPEERKVKIQVPDDEPKKGAAAGPDLPGKFCVQVASSRDRKEAEALKEKLAVKGFPVYVVESNIKDRGIWYRVKVGKHLSQRAAGELAGKLGKGALVIPE